MPSSHLRPELRLLVMSATLDTQAVGRLLQTEAVISAEGLSYPVQTRYLERAPADFIDRTATAAVLRALQEETGDLLVFLPGAGEIRRVQSALQTQSLPAGTRVLPLYGDLSADDQDHAIRPAPAGERKVVLATNIAETSLTIEGVHVVIDAGLERRARFDPGSGMSRLDTLRIARDSADQRRGRAGRLGPGICVRLWTEAQQRALPAQSTAEILEADLAPLALELAGWGAEADALRWLDPPPAATLAQARDLLAALGALDTTGRITAHGREMAAVGAHPRLAHLLIKAREADLAATGCALAALLGERDLLRGKERDADLRLRLEVLQTGRAPPGADVDGGAIQRVRRSAQLFERQLDVRGGRIEADAAGWLLACAYPDRIGRAREAKSGRYQLSNGRGAAFASAQALAGSEFIVVAELDAGEREARIYTAAPLRRDDIDAHFAEQIEVSDRIEWNSREQAVVMRREERLGRLVLGERPLSAADPALVARALLAGIRELGLDQALPWTEELRRWQARVQLVRQSDAAFWPDVSDAALTATLDDWLLPWIDGMSRRAHLAKLDLAAALQALLGWERQRQLDALAPTHLTVPSGSRIAIEYAPDAPPSLSVRLQEVFGLNATPRIVGGRVPVLMKLLSPARRPVQTTQDLQSFWSNTYQEVRKELKGRYPKHYWPEDPHQAEPTRRVRPR